MIQSPDLNTFSTKRKTVHIGVNKINYKKKFYKIRNIKNGIYLIKFQVIRRDIARTYPEHDFFKKKVINEQMNV